MNKSEKSVEMVIQLLKNIPNNFEEDTRRIPYYNMAATLTDAVLQAGMNYKNVVYPRVYNILNKYPDFCTTCDFIILFQTIPMEEIIQWKNPKKQQTICELAWRLYYENINTEDELAKWLENEKNVDSLLSIKGIGHKTVDYLKLLSGKPSIPIDRHMFQFLELAGIVTKDYKHASEIMKETAAYLKISEDVLDKRIWSFMSQKSDFRQITIYEL